MRKSNFLAVMQCRYLPALILFCLFCSVPAIADTGDYWAPWVTKTTTNSATINWRGESDGLGEIDYATSSYYNEHQNFDKTTASQTTGAYQHVQLTGLEPNTSYIYRVRPSGHEDVFSNRTFRTMPVSGPFTFIVISDSQEGHNYTEAMRFKLVADAIAKETDVLFILHGGDYAGHDSEGLWTKYFQAADAMLAKFPIFTTIGNHEYHNSGGDTPTDADQY
ncbi:MAG: fibronectin type III domain-containing protein, partial [Proteobacteria bacterium]|nr:fibronectin type III domain-containing protein [Pseudomonadota bacterium]